MVTHSMVTHSMTLIDHWLGFQGGDNYHTLNISEKTARRTMVTMEHQ